MFLEAPHSLLLINNSELLLILFFNYFYKIILPTSGLKYSFNYEFSLFKSLSCSPKLLYNLEFFNLRSFRVVFKGKGFRVRIFRSIKKATFNFGHSHWTKLKLLSLWFLYKRRRQSYVFITCDKNNFLDFSKILPNIRLMNRYTQRGLRLKKQAIKRRFGKISQYISSLH